MKIPTFENKIPDSVRWLRTAYKIGNAREKTGIGEIDWEKFKRNGS